MNTLKLNGRSLGEPVVSEEAHADRYSVRVDSATNPEFWFEIEIQNVKLIEMLEMVLAVRGELHNGNLTALRAIRAQLNRAPVDG